MDARIKSGMTGQNFKSQNNFKHAFTTSPRHAPEPLMNLSPLKGVGTPDAWHPRLVSLVVVERTR